MSIAPGLKGSIRRQVTEDMSTDRLGIAGLSILASPILGLLFELAALEALNQAQEPALKTVGARLEVLHESPTPVGFEVRVEATLVEVNGRRLRFEIEAQDDLEQIGTGTHERVIIDWPRFLDSVDAKSRLLLPQVEGEEDR